MVKLKTKQLGALWGARRELVTTQLDVAADLTVVEYSEAPDGNTATAIYRFDGDANTFDLEFGTLGSRGQRMAQPQMLST